MTREMIEDCLLNSKVFRDAVLDHLESLSGPDLEAEIMAAFKESIVIGDITVGKPYVVNKLGFIKKIRDLSQNRVSDFMKAFPSIIPWHNYTSIPIETCLGLADSKHLVEYFINAHPRVLSNF